MFVDCIVIGVCGGSGSGKTTFTNLLLREFDDVSYISQDNYYHDQSGLCDSEMDKVNFDHPDTVDLNQLHLDIKKYKEGCDIDIPKYCFETHSRLGDKQVVPFGKIIIIEGLHVFNTMELREEFDLKIFLELESDIRLLRRIKRDVIERGRTYESVVAQYENTTRPMYKEFVSMQKEFCDIVFNTEHMKSYKKQAQEVKSKVLDII